MVKKSKKKEVVMVVTRAGARAIGILVKKMRQVTLKHAIYMTKNNTLYYPKWSISRANAIKIIKFRRNGE